MFWIIYGFGLNKLGYESDHLGQMLMLVKNIMPDQNINTGTNANGQLSSRGGMGIKSRLLNPVDFLWDLRMGVKTFGYKPAQGKPDSPDLRVHYTPTPYRILFKILRRVKIDSQDTFLDLGCGLGRAVFAASWSGAQKSVGVEIDAELTAGAQATYENSHMKDRNIEFVCTSAETFNLHDATVIYMFHPFGSGTMRKVIQTLEQNLKKRPRKLRIAYLNPIHAKIIDAATSLRRLDEWSGQKGGGKNHPVAFWETISV